MKLVEKNLVFNEIKQKLFSYLCPLPMKKERNTSSELAQKAKFTHFVKETVFILSGIFAASFGLKGFLLPNQFIDGGVTGISLLVAEVSGWALGFLLVLINLPFIIIGLSQIGKQFALKSILAIVGLAVSVHFISYPIITDDALLIAAFGGFFLGLGIGLAMRGGAVLDGTEVLAIYLSKRTGLTIGDVILIFNILIFSVAAYIFSIEIALYAILTYLVASRTVDFVVDGLEEYTAVSIVSERHEELRLMITEELGHGVTLYDAKRGYFPQGETPPAIQVIYTVITRLEIAKLQTEIDAIDPNAFVIMSSVKDTIGGVIKKKKHAV